MNDRKQILDVDFIGGLGSLTTSEEKSLSNFFQKLKQKTTSKHPIKSIRATKRKFVTV